LAARFVEDARVALFFVGADLDLAVLGFALRFLAEPVFLLAGFLAGFLPLLRAPSTAPDTAPTIVPTTGVPTAVPTTAPATAPPRALRAVLSRPSFFSSSLFMLSSAKGVLPHPGQA
jgi:hypothetical protein